MIARFIHTVALLAVLLVLVCGLWQDWGFWTSVKRMVVSYLGFYCLGSLLALLIRSVPYWEGKRQADRQDAAPKT